MGLLSLFTCVKTSKLLEREQVRMTTMYHTESQLDG